MKRLTVALAVVLFAFTFANARAAQDPSSGSSKTLSGAPVTLADLPDVAQCRGIMSQIVLDLVNNASEDPADTFEKNRRAHPHMIMMPAPL